VKNSNVIVPKAQPPAARRGFIGFGRNRISSDVFLRASSLVKAGARHGILMRRYRKAAVAINRAVHRALPCELPLDFAWRLAHIPRQ
jgi:hypothetical protein